jgi:hypothetical protein
MKTIEAHIPEPVLKQAQELAARENIPLDQIISLAVTQAVGVWSNESYVALRAKRANQAADFSLLRSRGFGIGDRSGPANWWSPHTGTGRGPWRAGCC